jgi:hypothetical protein
MQYFPNCFQVINLYLDLLKERELRQPSKFLKCHFFNTFFYKKVGYYTHCLVFFFLFAPKELAFSSFTHLTN